MVFEVSVVTWDHTTWCLAFVLVLNIHMDRFPLLLGNEIYKIFVIERVA